MLSGKKYHSSTVAPKAAFTLRSTSHDAGPHRPASLCRPMSCAVWTPLNCLAGTSCYLFLMYNRKCWNLTCTYIVLISFLIETWNQPFFKFKVILSSLAYSKSMRYLWTPGPQQQWLTITCYIDLSRSRDVIGHVTIWFPIGVLLVILWNQASISNGFRDIQWLMWVNGWYVNRCVTPPTRRNSTSFSTNLFRLVETRRDCRKLVANSIAYTPPTQVNLTVTSVELRRRCVIGIWDCYIALSFASAGLSCNYKELQYVLRVNRAGAFLAAAVWGGVASGVATSSFGGRKNSGWHNAWLSEWCNLTPAMQCHAVNTAIL